MRISDWSSDVCSSDLKCSGACGIGLAALEILARGREAVDRTRGGQEGYPVTEFLGPGIPREDCVACRIVIGCSERCLLAVNCSEQPFRIIGRREAARAWREVAQAQADQFDGRSGGNEDRELLFKSLAARPPCGLARAVLNLTCRMPACRQRRGGPQTDIFFVAQVQSFALGVADGVVEQGREPALTAARRPGERQADFGQARTDDGVG